MIVFPNNHITISLAGFHGIICETANIEAEIEDLSKKGIKVGEIDETHWGNMVERSRRKQPLSARKVICRNVLAS